jgi:hypothetical protein
MVRAESRDDGLRLRQDGQSASWPSDRPIELLREHGADPLRENENGQSPAGLAHLIANYDVARFFTDLP